MTNILQICANLRLSIKLLPSQLLTKPFGRQMASLGRSESVEALGCLSARGMVMLFFIFWRLRKQTWVISYIFLRV